MKLEPDPAIPGVLHGTPMVHEDARGWFLEIFREDALGATFVQGNHSHSRAGVLRGLHYHRRQSDAWYVIAGEVQAMLADLRTPSASPAVVSVRMTADQPRVLFIPPGVAHGFLAITDVDLIYWVTHAYDASDEFGVAWDDPVLSAPWEAPGGSGPILSERDRRNPRLGAGRELHVRTESVPAPRSSRREEGAYLERKQPTSSENDVAHRARSGA